MGSSFDLAGDRSYTGQSRAATRRCQCTRTKDAVSSSHLYIRRGRVSRIVNALSESNPGIAPASKPEAFHQQPGADQQRERETRLPPRPANSASAVCAGTPAPFAAFFERLIQIAAVSPAEPAPGRIRLQSAAKRGTGAASISPSRSISSRGAWARIAAGKYEQIRPITQAELLGRRRSTRARCFPCRLSGQAALLAPSATRMAISLRAAAAPTSNRLAMLAHAISNTIPTAPRQYSNDMLNRLHLYQFTWIVSPHSNRVCVGYSCSSSREIVSSRQPAHVPHARS